MFWQTVVLVLLASIVVLAPAAPVSVLIAVLDDRGPGVAVAVVVAAAVVVLVIWVVAFSLYVVPWLGLLVGMPIS